MKKIILLLSIVIAASCATSKSANDKEITVIYDYEVKDKIVIVGENTTDTELTGYHNSLSKKLSSALKENYKTINFSKQIPEKGRTLLIGLISPKLIKKDGKTICSIYYYCRLWQDRKQIKEITSTIYEDYTGEDLDHDETMALIAYTHQEMIKKIAREAAKSEK